MAGAYPLRRSGADSSVVPDKPGEVYEAERAGTGLMLIDLAQINGIAKVYEGPWFRRTYLDQRETKLDRTGDYWFCETVRQYGGIVVGDARFLTEHAVTRTLVYDPNARGMADS